MYIHSERVPRLYKCAAKILQQVVENRGSVKKLVFEAKHTNKKGICALVNESLRCFDTINVLIERTNLLSSETRLDPWLARILITELLWGKKQLPDKSLPLKTMLGYQSQLESEFKLVASGSTISKKSQHKVNKPRVVRINTILTSVENVVMELKNEDWTLVPFTGKSYKDFVSQTALLNEGEFMVDLHFNELLQFSCKTEFYRNRAYKNGLLILQDKASCLPTYLLNPEPGSTVLDMCAAPGMKTTHMAALLNNQGIVYAVERDFGRFATLNMLVDKYGATCVKTINQNALDITEKDCPNVKYILVDPSCSGSGITDRVGYDKDFKPIEERIDKLAGFQIIILKHALTHFSSAQRVVYSTCSIHSKENEFVVQEVLKHQLDFELVNAHDLLGATWKSSKSDANWGGITEKCLFMKPENDLTNGFFVAVFERTTNRTPNEWQNEETNANYTDETIDQVDIAGKAIKKQKYAKDDSQNFYSSDTNNDHKPNKQKNANHIESCLTETQVYVKKPKAKQSSNIVTDSLEITKSKKQNNTDDFIEFQTDAKKIKGGKHKLKQINAPDSLPSEEKQSSFSVDETIETKLVSKKHKKKKPEPIEEKMHIDEIEQISDFSKKLKRSKKTKNHIVEEYQEKHYTDQPEDHIIDFHALAPEDFISTKSTNTKDVDTETSSTKSATKKSKRKHQESVELNYFDGSTLKVEKAPKCKKVKTMVIEEEFLSSKKHKHRKNDGINDLNDIQLGKPKKVKKSIADESEGLRINLQEVIDQDTISTKVKKTKKHKKEKVEQSTRKDEVES